MTRHFPITGKRREVDEKNTQWLTLKNVATNNLKNITARFPLNKLIVVSGVSGSGKSTLIRECLLPAMQQALKKRQKNSVAKNLSGYEAIQSVYEVDQSPIGRTLRSTPATYAGFFDQIRLLMSQVPEARLRGYGGGRFSFNSAQGRCPECEGTGTIKLELNFLPPAFVKCETCNGSRFNLETLDIRLNGKNIAEILDLTVDEALVFFSAFRKISRPLQALADTGLGYLKLGQTSPTLSGGEAQRVKLVTHLAGGLHKPDEIRVRTKGNLFILEEPTIGLHMADVRRLIEVLHRLVNAGHTVIVIEHNLDLVAEADWLIDLGPEGGEQGGSIVAEGTPEDVAKVKRSHTGRLFADAFKIVMIDPYQETLEGGLCLRLPPGERHELICQRLHERIAKALASQSVTRLLTPRSEVTFSEDAIVCPDISLVTNANNKLWLAAEIINSGDHSPDTVTKKTIYEEFKIPRVWMIDPRYDNVEVYHGGPHGLILKQILAVNEVLSEPLLPGFEYVMSELFRND